MIEERDISVAMRDGTRLAVDVYRPDAPGKYPVLYASALHNKDIQGPDIADILPPQPAHAPLWFGPIEAGDTRRFIANGYVHVIAQPRGSAKSEGHYGHEDTDHYDLIEWITQQPWSNGKVGMVGISGLCRRTMARGRAGTSGAESHLSLRRVQRVWRHVRIPRLQSWRRPAHAFLICSTSSARFMSPVTGLRNLPAAEEDLWRRAMRNPDYKQYINLYNILTQKGQRTFIMYLMMTHPWEFDGTVERAEEIFKKIKIPFYTGSGAYAYTYKLHWLGAQHYFQNVDAPKKLLFTGPAHLERPFHQYHDEIIRWYDHWLKGQNTGIMDEPPVRYWLMGANEWRTGTDWPLPETQWTKYYLSHWETLSTEPPRPASRAWRRRARARRLHADAGDADDEGRAAALHD